MKGLILCGGKGTRLQPLTFTQPKALLPVANKPLVVYSIEKLIAEGIREIGIVVNPLQEQMVSEVVGDQKRYGVTITYIYQDEPLGIAHALKVAESFIDGESFVLLLGDNLIDESLKQLKEAITKSGVNGSVMLAKVSNPEEFGVAELKDNQIISLEEKPNRPKSNYAVIGAYAFDATIFKGIHAISPSKRGEYEITDAIQWMIDHHFSISCAITDHFFCDVGTPERWLQASRWMLDNKMKKSLNGQGVYNNCTIIQPVNIDDKCNLKDSIIGPYVTIASGSKIEGCQIKNSIILENVELKQIKYKIQNSIFGKATQMSNFESTSEDEILECIIGDKTSFRIRDS